MSTMDVATSVSHPYMQEQPEYNQSASQGEPSKPQRIFFEKVFLPKTADATPDFIGSIAITEDKNHKGWLHILIYIAQLFNSIISWKKRDSVDLCHAQVIIGINESDKKRGELLLAHGLFNGIKTTSENHKKDPVITGMYIYRPIDKKVQELFKKYADQTAVDFRKANLNPNDKDFKKRVKKEVGQFSITRMITSTFHRQIVKPYEEIQKRAAYAAADLLLGDKLKDEKGNLDSHLCSGYVMTLTQGVTLISALSDAEKADLEKIDREAIAQHILQRIKNKSPNDAVATVYWNHKFMQLDARYTMSYAAADFLNESSQEVAVA